MFSKLFRRAPATYDDSSQHALSSPTPLSSLDLKLQRRPERQEDLVLSGVARAWATDLPAGLHPRYLLDRCPRIANRLALLWGDSSAVNALFADYLSDRRGGRQGFPRRIRAELMLLEDHHAYLYPDAPPTTY